MLKELYGSKLRCVWCGFLIRTPAIHGYPISLTLEPIDRLVFVFKVPLSVPWTAQLDRRAGTFKAMGEPTGSMSECGPQEAAMARVYGVRSPLSWNCEA